MSELIWIRLCCVDHYGVPDVRLVLDRSHANDTSVASWVKGA